MPLASVPSYRKIWNLSYPIILSLLAQNLIAVIDTAFLGRVGEIELGASAIGGLFYYWIFMLG
ncbi:MAG: MATE family efflux transporter, partial [Bacteroidales bacterium]|nr:MATE family efflux transporter [Bacteroidales bacterium]